MYGVIVCPRCTLVQGADLSTARITCPRCRSKIEVRKAKVYFSTDSPRELAEGVRQVGERLVYDVEMPGAPRSPAPDRKPAGSDQRTLRSIVMQVLGEREEASRGDLTQALGGVSEEELDRIIGPMMETGIMYEASPGRYRAA